MAYGRHWEWRGFGKLPTETRRKLADLPSLFPVPELVTDDYLWVPGGKINIKLRDRGSGSLKLKRMERADRARGIELWVERPEEEFRFPLSPAAVRTLADDLGIVLPQPSAPIDREALLQLVAQAPVPIQLVSVVKRRDTRRYSTAGGQLLIEVADLERPEDVTSVSVEDDYGLKDGTSETRIEETGAAVTDAVKTFGLDSDLRRMNYLEALGFWGNGRSVRNERFKVQGSAHLEP